MRAVRRFLKHDQGQDLTEYTLIMAVIALASGALFLSAGGSVGGIWTSGSSMLITASGAASGVDGSTGSNGSSGPVGDHGCDHCDRH